MENPAINENIASGESGLMTRVLDAMPAGILLIRADRTIAYANDMFMQLWRVPDDVARYRNDFALMNHVLGQVADVAGFIGLVERLYASMETSQDEVKFKDGRVFWRRSYPVLEDDGQVARAWVFADISESRKALLETLASAGQALGAQTSQATDGDGESWLDRKKRRLREAFKL